MQSKESNQLNLKSDIMSYNTELNNFLAQDTEQSYKEKFKKFVDAAKEYYNDPNNNADLKDILQVKKINTDFLNYSIHSIGPWMLDNRFQDESTQYFFKELGSKAAAGILFDKSNFLINNSVDEIELFFKNIGNDELLNCMMYSEYIVGDLGQIILKDPQKAKFLLDQNGLNLGKYAGKNTLSQLFHVLADDYFNKGTVDDRKQMFEFLLKIKDENEKFLLDVIPESLSDNLSRNFKGLTSFAKAALETRGGDKELIEDIRSILSQRRVLIDKSGVKHLKELVSMKDNDGKPLVDLNSVDDEGEKFMDHFIKRNPANSDLVKFFLEKNNRVMPTEAKKLLTEALTRETENNYNIKYYLDDIKEIVKMRDNDDRPLVDLNYMNTDGNSLIGNYRRNPEMLQFLLKQNGDVITPEVQGSLTKALIIDVQYGNIGDDALSRTIEMKDKDGRPLVDVNYVNNQGNSLMTFYDENPHMRKFLMEHGADYSLVAKAEEKGKLQKILEDRQSAHGDRTVNNVTAENMKSAKKVNLHDSSEPAKQFFDQLITAIKEEDAEKLPQALKDKDITLKQLQEQLNKSKQQLIKDKERDGNTNSKEAIENEFIGKMEIGFNNLINGNTKKEMYDKDNETVNVVGEEVNAISYNVIMNNPQAQKKEDIVSNIGDYLKELADAATTYGGNSQSCVEGRLKKAFSTNFGKHDALPVDGGLGQEITNEEKFIQQLNTVNRKAGLLAAEEVAKGAFRELPKYAQLELIEQESKNNFQVPDHLKTEVRGAIARELYKNGKDILKRENDVNPQEIYLAQENILHPDNKYLLKTLQTQQDKVYNDLKQQNLSQEEQKMLEDWKNPHLSQEEQKMLEDWKNPPKPQQTQKQSSEVTLIEYRGINLPFQNIEDAIKGLPNQMDKPDYKEELQERVDQIRKNFKENFPREKVTKERFNLMKTELNLFEEVVKKAGHDKNINYDKCIDFHIDNCRNILDGKELGRIANEQEKILEQKSKQQEVAELKKYGKTLNMDQIKQGLSKLNIKKYLSKEDSTHTKPPQNKNIHKKRYNEI